MGGWRAGKGKEAGWQLMGAAGVCSSFNVFSSNVRRPVVAQHSLSPANIRQRKGQRKISYWTCLQTVTMCNSWPLTNRN